MADLLVAAADPAADIASLRRIRYVVRGGLLYPLAELGARGERLIRTVYKVAELAADIMRS